MDNIIKLVVNNEVVLEYDKNVALPEGQKAYLEDMDKRMDKGIFLADRFIAQPDQTQRAQFVTLMMLKFLDEDKDNDAIAMFTYLVNRLTDLKQVKARGEKGKYQFELVYDKDFSDYQPIQFH